MRLVTADAGRTPPLCTQEEHHNTQIGTFAHMSHVYML